MNVDQVKTASEPDGTSAQAQSADETCHIALSSVTAPSLRADVAEGADAAVLLRCVEEEVARHCQPGNPVGAAAAEEPNRRELLGVLAFAYARRIFDSEEIADRCLTDESLRQLCNGHAPFASELIRYRRHNRPLIETVLANVLLRVDDCIRTGGPTSTPPALKRQLLCHAATRLDTARHVDTLSE